MNMKEIRSAQRLRKNQAKQLRRQQALKKINGPDQVPGLIAFKNWFDHPDPTPALADRLYDPELSILN